MTITIQASSDGNKVKHHVPKRMSFDGLSLDYNLFSQELSRAQYALGLLQGSQRRLDNAHLLISPLTAKEAKESSSIEGTVSTVSDVFLYEAGGKPKFEDTQQVANYRKAMVYALDELGEGKNITIGLIKKIHKILLTKVRHEGKLGDFREEIVYVAEKKSDPIEKATYVPMLAVQVQEYMDNLLEYSNKGAENILIKAGIFHYQFEAIHPFNDGNGRIGRLLIPLLLYHQNKLSRPILYMSGYFEKNRDKYIDALHSVDVSGNYESWLAFYLDSVSKQLGETQSLINSIYSLYDEIIKLYDKNKSPYITKLINHIFDSPMTTIPMAKRAMGASTRNTVAQLINDMVEQGVLGETKQTYQRAKLYGFPKLLKIIK